MLCHVPSLMVVRNLARLKSDRVLFLGFRWYFSVEEHVVELALGSFSVSFFYILGLYFGFCVFYKLEADYTIRLS